MTDLRHNYTKRVEGLRAERDRAAVPALTKAALALGGTPRETCGKSWPGRPDTSDLICQRVSGHDGACKASVR